MFQLEEVSGKRKCSRVRRGNWPQLGSQEGTTRSCRGMPQVKRSIGHWPCYAYNYLWLPFLISVLVHYMVALLMGEIR